MPASYEQQITLAGDLHARPAGALAVAAVTVAATAPSTNGASASSTFWPP